MQASSQTVPVRGVTQDAATLASHATLLLPVKIGPRQAPSGWGEELTKRALSTWRAAEPVPSRVKAPAEGRLGNWLLMRVLDEIDYGLMLVDERTKVHYANNVAMCECSTAHALQLNDGYVRPSSERNRSRFSNALEAARRGRRSLLSLDGGATVLSLAVVPLAHSPDSVLEANTLLVFGKRKVCEQLSIDFFSRAHQLTSAECVVLRCLCDGLRPAQVAARVGVAISTVRTQIGSIRVKTETASIGALIQTVMALPPIVPALNKGYWELNNAEPGACAQ